jgi:hypothetical protein
MSEAEVILQKLDKMDQTLRRLELVVGSLVNSWRNQGQEVALLKQHASRCSPSCPFRLEEEGEEITPVHGVVTLDKDS